MQLGSNVSLTCRFSMPSALVFFEHNSTVITPLDTDTFFFQYTGANATLFLRNVALLHTGTYLCRAAISATNHVLSAEATISIASEFCCCLCLFVCCLFAENNLTKGVKTYLHVVCLCIYACLCCLLVV